MAADGLLDMLLTKPTLAPGLALTLNLNVNSLSIHLVFHLFYVSCAPLVLEIKSTTGGSTINVKF